MIIIIKERKKERKNFQQVGSYFETESLGCAILRFSHQAGMIVARLVLIQSWDFVSLSGRTALFLFNFLVTPRLPLTRSGVHLERYREVWNNYEVEFGESSLKNSSFREKYAAIVDTNTLGGKVA